MRSARWSPESAERFLAALQQFADDSKAFVWARTNMGEAAGNRIVRYTLRTGKLSYAIGSNREAARGQ